MRDFQKEADLWEIEKKKGILKYSFKKAFLQSTIIFATVSFFQFVSWKDGVHFIANDGFKENRLGIALAYFLFLTANMLFFALRWLYKNKQNG